MPLQHAIDFPRIRRAFARLWIGEVLRDELAAGTWDQRWAGQPHPRPNARRFVMLNFVGMPQPRQIDHSEVYRQLPTGIRFTLGPELAAGQQLRLLVNRYPHDAVVVTPNDPDAAAELLASVVNDGPEPVDATTSPGGVLTVAPRALGDLVSARLVPAALAPNPVRLGTVDCTESGGTRAATLSVTVVTPTSVSGSGSGEYSADQVAVDLVAHLARKRPIRNRLNLEGIGIWSTSIPRDVAALQGTELERTVQFDVRMSVRARLIDPTSVIERVEQLATIGGTTTTITAPPE